MRKLKIGYVPINNTLNSPGDKRRFVYYAEKKNIEFEIASFDKYYDLIILTQNADISLWSKYKDKYKSSIIVYDLIDSYLSIPKYNIKGLFRGLAKYIVGQNKYLQLNYWKSIEKMCSISDAVICSTIEQKNIIFKFNNNVHIILDAHFDLTKKIKNSYSISNTIKIVWEGLPHTLDSLKILTNVLNKLDTKLLIELHIITDLKYKKYMGLIGQIDTYSQLKNYYKKIYIHEWTQENCSNIITSCDLAVIPIDTNDDFSLGKPENKLLLFWRMAIPVICSSTPAYIRAMEMADINLIANCEREWYDKILELVSDELLRKDIGLKGKMYTDQFHSESILISKWDLLFESLNLK